MAKKFAVFSIILIFLLSGCATAPIRENIPTYSLNGTTYYALIPLCNLRGINWEYDTFTKTVTLKKDSHTVNLTVGDELILLDGGIQRLSRPVDMYQGTIVVPYKFKEEIIDVLFKEYYPVSKGVFLSRIKKVVIDPGHGGNDPGTIGRTGLKEKDVNLDLAKRLGNLLKTQGVEVIYTRTTDRFIPLESRVDIANRSDADLFISIHSNANRVRSLNGFEVYYVAASVSDSSRAVTSARSVGINLEDSYLANHSLVLKATLWDMIYTFNRAESIELSRSICRSINNNCDIKVNGVKGARYYVLKGIRMPGILIEAGFLSNASEERMLKNAFYRQKIAESIMDGIGDYAQGAYLMEVAKR
ncbi:MAG: N-acetylmuramoyl-L-alanine amidase [Candidatus Omnitrophota bacterium]|jgi:N-acetylmuramoyl-L-alanine amidase